MELMQTRTVTRNTDIESRVSAIRVALRTLDVPLPESGEDRENFEFLVEYCPDTLGKTVLNIDSTTRSRRYLWCNAFRIIIPQSRTSLTSKKDYFERNFALWAEVIRFSEELYLPADENDTWTEHQLSSMALCLSNLIDRGESLPVLLATMLSIRNDDFGKRSWVLIESKDEISRLADRIEDALPLVPELVRRKDTSYAAVEMMLDSGPSSLSSGWL